MGIPTDPGYRLYVDDNICFPAGKTPKKIFLTLSGIECGYYWIPERGMPLNGTFILESGNNNHWYAERNGWSLDFGLTNGITMMYVGGGGIPEMFMFYRETSCLFAGENDSKTIWRAFYGGNFVAVPRD